MTKDPRLQFSKKHDGWSEGQGDLLPLKRKMFPDCGSSYAASMLTGAFGNASVMSLFSDFPLRGSHCQKTLRRPRHKAGSVWDFRALRSKMVPVLEEQEFSLVGGASIQNYSWVTRLGSAGGLRGTGKWTLDRVWAWRLYKRKQSLFIKQF